ncbi:MAG: hypothetical protein EXR72_25195 [Myxococcales bacterium]|nr:hypothetical protein [Myxococcales bacterium]
MTRAAAAGLLALLLGCERPADPCAKYPGVACLAVHVRPSVATEVDRLIIAVAGPGIELTGDSAGAKAVLLPAAVALVFPRLDAAAEVTVRVTGVLGGRAVGAGEGAASIAPARHDRIEVTLGDPGDAGVPDAGADLVGPTC